MFSQTAEYALRAVVFLAGRRDSSVTASEIARGTTVPEGYLAKVLQSLGRGGIVRAQRGKHGGFVLARAPEQLTLLDVIEAVDPIRRIRQCPLGLPGHGEHLCALHRRLDDAMKTVEQTLQEATLADLLRGASPVKPLCAVAGACDAN